MGLVKRTVMEPVTYWDCGNSNHRHKRKVVAEGCIDEAASRKRKLSKEERFLRDITAADAWIDGATMKAAGELVGLSGERIRQILQIMLRMSQALGVYTGDDKLVDWADAVKGGKLKPEHKSSYSMRVNAVARRWGCDEREER